MFPEPDIILREVARKRATNRPACRNLTLHSSGMATIARENGLTDHCESATVAHDGQVELRKNFEDAAATDLQLLPTLLPVLSDWAKKLGCVLYICANESGMYCTLEIQGGEVPCIDTIMEEMSTDLDRALPGTKVELDMLAAQISLDIASANNDPNPLSPEEALNKIERILEDETIPLEERDTLRALATGMGVFDEPAP